MARFSHHGSRNAEVIFQLFLKRRLVFIKASFLWPEFAAVVSLLAAVECWHEIPQAANRVVGCVGTTRRVAMRVVGAELLLRSLLVPLREWKIHFLGLAIWRMGLCQFDR